MSRSFEKIDYTLRPNKSVERKMMLEAIQKLMHLDDFRNYRYIGFGSTYFADFILVHKVLGINDLISIEQEKGKKDRFEFNIPFTGIQMEYDKCKLVLPNLELHSKKNILWLDYDYSLHEDIFEDINTFFTNTQPGSFFIISINIDEVLAPKINDISDYSSFKNIQEYRKEKFFDRVSSERMPSQFSECGFTTHENVKIAYELINRQIETSLNDRNAGIEDLKYKQVFNFIYNDNATMLTLGGIIYDKSQSNIIKKMNFESLPFFVNDANSFSINCPKLTLKEKKTLDKLLPRELIKNKHGLIANKEFKELLFLSTTDIINYAKVYRYYPNFSEVNL